MPREGSTSIDLPDWVVDIIDERRHKEHRSRPAELLVILEQAGVIETPVPKVRGK